MSVDDLFSGLNPVVRTILRAPVLHWVLSPFLMLVTVTGRRSGRSYTIPVGYQLDGRDLTVLVSEAHKKQWWRNYRDPRAVRVRVRGRSSSGEARVVGSDAPDYRRRVEGALRKVPRLDRVFGIEFDRSRGLTDEQVEHLATEIAVVHIALSG